jgi:hypothetical protein
MAKKKKVVKATYVMFLYEDDPAEVMLPNGQIATLLDHEDDEVTAADLDTGVFRILRGGKKSIIQRGDDIELARRTPEVGRLHECSAKALEARGSSDNLFLVTVQPSVPCGIVISPTKEVQVDNIIELKHNIQALLHIFHDAHNNKNVMKAVDALRDIVEIEADNRDIPLEFYEMNDKAFLERIAKT